MEIQISPSGDQTLFMSPVDTLVCLPPTILTERMWDLIVLTCSRSFLIDIEEEIKFLQKKLQICQTPILTVDDPADNIGSGAATLNALLVATEYLSVQNNYTVMTVDVLTEAHILIFHMGRGCAYSNCGNAFISLPLSCEKHASHGESFCFNFELLLNTLEKFKENSLPGVWVCGTDMSLLNLGTDAYIPWKTNPDAIMFCVPVEADYASNHGTISIDEQGFVADIIYCGSNIHIQQYKQANGLIPIVSGIVFLSCSVVESLLSLHVQSPFQSCTYVGFDSGLDGVQVSLFFDILIAMATNISEETFVSGRCGKLYNAKVGFSEGDLQNISLAGRTLMWQELSKFKMTAAVLDGFQHLYWSDHFPASKYIKNILSVTANGKHHTNTHASCTSSKPYCLMINSSVAAEDCKLSSGGVIVDSEIKAKCFSVGENCYISSLYIADAEQLSLEIPNNLVIINYSLRCVTENSLTVVFGIHDKLHLPVTDPNSMFANKSWKELFKWCNEDDIWDCTVERTKRTLLNAKLYIAESSANFMLQLIRNQPDTFDLLRWKQSKRYSIAEALMFADYSKQFSVRRNVFASIVTGKVVRILQENEDQSLLSYFHSSCNGNWCLQLVDALDSILKNDARNIILARTLFAMADLLSIMAGKVGVLRNGPGCNKSWSSAFEHLACGKINMGVNMLKNERQKWLDRPVHMIRAARHYERAANILIRKSVLTVEEFVKLELGAFPEIDSWITVECPARIDFQGGWTDTPPISYELEGSVVNIAITVDGKKPIKAAAKRKNELNIELRFGAGRISDTLLINKVKDIMDYDQPNAHGALLKAAVVYSKIIDVHSPLSLEEQLLKNCHSGIHLYTHSHLPQGCGLGTSSILAGAIITVLWSLLGRKFDNSSVIHAVLCIEQLLTTGGGWQDQVGGLIGGVKHGFSRVGLPHHVQFNILPVPASVLEVLNGHLLLIYTGKVRLAKNLLQNVIRNWYARDPFVVKCFKSLISSSLDMEQALIEGNLKKIGFLLNQYWKQKKVLAPGCEPEAVKIMMEALNPIVFGQTLTGAGGGGFLCVLTKRYHAVEEVKALLSKLKDAEKISIHFVSIDNEGMKLSVSNKHYVYAHEVF